MLELWKVGILVAVLLLVCALTTILICRHIIKKNDRVMFEVNETIESLISGRRSDYFSQTEDTLLGKFQHEILQLNDMLRSYEEREAQMRQDLSCAISDLVHQLNTPITNIRLYSDFLTEPDLEEEKRRLFGENIKKQAEKLGWLGEGFSRISRLETGIMKLHPQNQKIIVPILRAIDQISWKAIEHGNEILLEGNQELKACLDEKWTEELFFNLLDNAVKYSHRGSEILIFMQEYEMFVRVDVTDTGLTISREECAKIFGRLYRGKEVCAMEGVGLGLYLAREIARGQQGYLKVGSTKTGKTTFSVFLIKKV